MNKTQSILLQSAHYIVLSACSVFIVWWFRVYLTSEAVASVDLPSQIALTKQLKQQLLAGHLSFYDPSTFTGWPAFQFYGFFPSLLSAFCAYFLSLFNSSPVLLSTHLLLVLGAALLPFSMYFTALPLGRDLFGNDHELPVNQRWTLAVTCSVWSFWFLNHDQQWYGIGAAAPMNIGLFAQIIGWHVFLLHLGLLLRFIQSGTNRLSSYVSLSFGLLLISHTLTFVFSSFIVLLSWCWFNERRRGLLTAHLLGIGLVAFWFLPFVSFMGDYTSYSIIRPKGDFLELFFRYPLYGLVRSIRTWLDGDFKLLNPINIVNLFLFSTLFSHHKINKTGLLWVLFTFLLLALIVFSSGFVASSLPLGLHYYRFLSYCFMLTVLIVCVVPLAFIKQENNRATLTITLVAISCFVITLSLPHEKRELIQNNSSNAHLLVQHQVLDYFKALPEKGRVYVEFIKEDKNFTPLSRHYISSRLYEYSGFESVVSSHLQETVAYRMIVASAKMLGAKTYNSALLFRKHAQLNDRDNIERLKSFGITHLVAGREAFFHRVKRFAVSDPVKIGGYRIVQIQQLPSEKIAAVHKPVIGFLDLKGNLPFHLLEFYFYSRKQLSNHFELIRIEDDKAIPSGLAGLLVNYDGEKDQLSNQWETADQQVIEINFTSPYLLNHYKPHYPHNVEIDAYNEVEKYLGKVVKLPKRFTRVFGQLSNPRKLNKENPSLFWSDDQQTMYLDGLQPGMLYRINYSYFPYWRSRDGNVLRGSGERIFYRAEKQSAILEYRNWGFVSTTLGYLITLIAWIWIAMRFRALKSV